MTFTNDLGLPEPFARAAERLMARYSKGRARYSVTELLKPARAAALGRAYADRFVVDVADCLYLLDGSLSHDMLHAAGVEDTGATILEERLFADVGGVTISGAMDCAVLLPTGKISDYKKTSVWAIMDGVKAEWTQQLNSYVLLSALNDRPPVTALEIIAWLRDWSIAKARAGGRYPRKQVAVLPVPLWTLDQTRAFLEARIAAHMAADAQIAENPDSLVLCTDEERWVRDRKWAVMKPGRKSAVALCASRAEADLRVMETAGLYVEERGGQPVRCLDYCDAGKAGLCTQWNAERDLVNAATGEGDSAGPNPFGEGEPA